MYLFDVHTHTAEVSPCGRLTAEQSVAHYVEMGYAGICVTDHFNINVIKKRGGVTWEEKVDNYLRGYRLAKAAGEKMGLTVLFGMEVQPNEVGQIYDSYNEYLVYGLQPQFLYDNPYLYDYSVEALALKVHENGGMIFQAHPFRRHMVRVAMHVLDGIEAYNGNPRHNSSNDLAIATAKANHWGMVSGSDSHQTEDGGHGGLMLWNHPKTEQELVAELKANKYALICSTEKF